MERAPTCLVTGATSGIGRATAVELARRGARVLVHGRTLEKARRACVLIAEQAPQARLEPVGGNLASLAQVRALADDVAARFPELSVLINNAAVERRTRQVTVDGFELGWAVNHLAPFLLTARLAPVLVANAPARVVNVSSEAHRLGHLDWDDLQLQRAYHPGRAYYRTKLASLMAFLELSRRWSAEELSVLQCHPGLVGTGFWHDFRGLGRWASESLGPTFLRRPARAAREVADLALSERWAGQTGLYVRRGHVERPAERALDVLAQRRVFENAVRSTGVEVPAAPPAAALVLGPVRVPRAQTFRRWLAACTAGELLGFGAAGLWAYLAFRLFGAEPSSWGERLSVLGLMVLAGVFEGAVLGGVQWLALRRSFPALKARSWLGATVAVASAGWLVGMLPPTLLGAGDGGAAVTAVEPPLGWVLAGASLFGALAGTAFGFAQWLVLRHAALDARRWIGANALGWALGLPFAYWVASVGDLGVSVPTALLLGALGGAAMGAAVALATGHALVRLQPRQGAGILWPARAG